MESSKESSLTSIIPAQTPYCRATAPARRRIWPVVCSLAPVVLCLLGACWEFRRPWFQANVGIVEPNRVFRSAQPSSQLEAWIRDYQVKSILNLRGGSSADWWYDAETRTALAHGVSFYDLPLAATRRPTRRDLLLLIDVLMRCPYPLWIHCKSGADRTGLASALYLMMQRAQPPERAERAFSLEYGHIPYFGTEHLHEPLDEYAGWLKDRKLAHSPDRFRSWVLNDYRAPDAHVEPRALRPGPRERQPQHAATKVPASAQERRRAPFTDREDTATGLAGIPQARRPSAP
jgi:hypothetical protein